MSLTISTSDYQKMAQALTDDGEWELAQKLYEFHGPFKLHFSDETPNWYDY